MEKKLAEYRARQQRQELLEKCKRFFTKAPKNEDESYQIVPTKDIPTKEKDSSSEEELIESDPEPLPEKIIERDDDENYLFCSFVKVIKFILYLILWATVYAIFIKLQFGMVFLVVSGLVAMYLNTRTGPKDRNEPSAYSVFNKNCESLDGAIDPKQFERELVYGVAGMR